MAGRHRAVLQRGSVVVKLDERGKVCPDLSNQHPDCRKAGCVEVCSDAPWHDAIAHQTMAESGVKGYDVTQWYGMFLPARTPQLIVDKLSSEVIKAAQHPDVRFVLDHAGKPPVAAGWGSAEAREWAGLVSALASLPQLVVKLSGLTTMADLERWTVADLAPWVDHLLEAVGPERLMFGSDWPVSRRAGDYPRTIGAVRELLARLSPGEQDHVLRGTAERVYRLTPSGA